MENKFNSNNISTQGTTSIISNGLNDFQILKKLGQGSFSEVYKIQNMKTGKEYAMKRIKLNSLKP